MRLLPAFLLATLLSLGAQASTLEFSGYTWDVKTAVGEPVGPGPNLFAKDAAFVDTQGRLHLRVFERAGKWQSAEVVLGRTLGYGRYEFRLASPVDNLDPNVVLGLFTWSDAVQQNHRELDIEFARWGNPKDTTNAQYVVQPYQTQGNLLRWSAPADTATRHLWDWRPGDVSFESYAGAQLLSLWRRRGFGVVPEPGDSRVRMNLWLYEGRPPQSGQSVEVIIESFTFAPH